MGSILIITITSLSLILLMCVFFLVNPSYEKSIRAKYYFEVGEYQEALVLAKESFAIDVYNRMAATVMAQTITSLKYVEYINMGEKYIKEIDEIATHEFISDADKAKIRIICEIMIGSYIKISHSVITDKELIKQSENNYQKFNQLIWNY